MKRVSLDPAIEKFIRHMTSKEIFSARILVTLVFIPAYCMFADPTIYAYLPLPFLFFFIGIQFLKGKASEQPWMRYASPIAELLLNASAICNTGFQRSPLLFLILMPVITYGMERGPRWALRSALLYTPLLVFLALRALVQRDLPGIAYVLAMTATSHTASRFIRKAQEFSKFHVSLLEDIAARDALTDLYNRRALKRYMEEMASRGIPYGFILCDLDGFKAYNDIHGHQEGDEILRCFGGLLKESLRPLDTAFRYGGDEFAVILLEADHHSLDIVKERIRGAIQRRMKGLGISFGVAIYPLDGKTPEDIIKAADRRLYENKRSRLMVRIDRADETKKRYRGESGIWH